MTVLEDETQADAPEHPASPLAGIRERLREKQAEHKPYVDIPMPGALENELALRHRPLDFPETEKIDQRDVRGDRAKLERYMSYVIRSCVCVLYREQGRWVELEEGDKPVRIDGRLAAALNIPDGKVGGQPIDTHLILRGLFALAAGGVSPDDEQRWERALAHADHMIDAHHTQYMLWLRGGLDINAEQEQQEEMLGESSATLA